MGRSRPGACDSRRDRRNEDGDKQSGRMNKSKVRRSLVKAKLSALLPLNHGHSKKMKPSSNHLDFEQAPDQEEEAAPVVEEVDVYKDLRFSEEAMESAREPPKLSVSFWPMRSVLVKKLRPDFQEKPAPALQHQGLMLPVGIKEEELQVYSGGRGMLHQQTEGMHREAQEEDSISGGLRLRALQAQNAALQSWSKMGEQRSSLADTLSEQQGRPPHDLLFNRTLPLPPLQNHQGPSLGPGSDFPPVPQWKQHERFYNNDAFFLLPEYIGPKNDSFASSLTWSQRQLYKPPFSIVRLDLGQQDTSEQQTDPVQGHTCVQSDNAEQSAEMAAQLKLLYLRGEGLPKKTANDSAEGTMSSGAEEVPLEEREQSSTAEDNQSLVVETTDLEVGASGCGQELPAERSEQGLEPETDVPATLPAFRVHTSTYVWGQPCPRDIVEIGVVCDEGERGLTKIQLANVGCCAMRYWWRRVPHVDYFNTGRYRPSPFVFNFSDGILLPRDEVSITVYFCPPYAGSWIESWFLQTTPCVGPGERGEIPLNLWGHALEVDVHQQDRQRLDDELDRSAAQRASERFVWDLVKFLPIRSQQEQALDLVEPLPERVVPDDVAAFLEKNKGLYYHSSAMVLLLSAYRDLQNPSMTGLAEPLQLEKSARCSRSRRSNQSAECSIGASSFKRALSPYKGSKDQTRSSTMSITKGTATLSTLDMAVGYGSVDQYQVPRAKIVVSELYRDVYTLDELSRKKEDLLGNINRAVLIMSLKNYAPTQKHYKYILMRQALVQLCDEIDRAEMTLRRNLGLQDDPRFQRQATFPVEDLKYGLKRKSLVGQRRKRKITVRSRKRESTMEAPICWTEPRHQQYHQKLRMIIYVRLAAVLGDMLPIMTYDGYCLKP